MTHAIPNAIGIAFATMVVFAVKQSVFIKDGVLHAHSGATVRTCDMLNNLFFHAETNQDRQPVSILPLFGLVHRQPVYGIDVI